MWFILLPLALAAGKWDDKNADVVATAVVPAPADVIFNRLLSLEEYQALLTPQCATKWVYGDVKEGVGANAQLTYHAAGMARRLTATLSKVEQDRRITLDHPGNRGFTTTWTLTPDGDNTAVELHTWINPPPKPFKGYYFKRVQPAWERCHEGVLRNLSAAVGG